jgi:predicted nucleotidyltransferase
VNNVFTNFDIDTVLVVNSCARGQAVPESDLDFCILVNKDMPAKTGKAIEKEWLKYSASDSAILKYKKSTLFVHLHLDIINGIYIPAVIENGEPIDYFEVAIGNRICYAAPFDNCGEYYRKLQEKWLPFYDENARLKRLSAISIRATTIWNTSRI